MKRSTLILSILALVVIGYGIYYTYYRGKSEAFSSAVSPCDAFANWFMSADSMCGGNYLLSISSDSAGNALISSSSQSLAGTVSPAFVGSDCVNTASLPSCKTSSPKGGFSIDLGLQNNGKVTFSTTQQVPS